MSINVTISNVIEFLEKCFTNVKTLNCNLGKTDVIVLDFDNVYELQQLNEFELAEINMELEEITCELPEIELISLAA